MKEWTRGRVQHYQAQHDEIVDNTMGDEGEVDVWPVWYGSRSLELELMALAMLTSLVMGMNLLMKWVGVLRDSA